MTEQDLLEDVELDRLLARWSDPELPEGIDQRMLAAYRRERPTREPWWSRLFTASVRVPVPVAVALLLLLIVSLALVLRPMSTPPTAGTAGPSEPVQAARQVDPPLVTRTDLAGFRPVSEVTATVVQPQEMRQ